MSAMTTTTATARRDSRYVGAPKLRLLGRGESQRFEGAPLATIGARRAHGSIAAPARATRLEASRPAETSLPADAPVLIAGCDADRRAAMIEELKSTMAPGTKFVHASAFWEVLVLAGQSCMVILSGALDEMPTDSLMRMLGHRYPALPVVALDAPAHAYA